MPAVGAVVTIAGALLMAVNQDGQVIVGLAGWDFWFVGLVTLVVGSGLFALASWRSGSVSRAGSALLGASAVILVIALPPMLGLLAIPWEPLLSIALAALLLTFSAGWIVLGLGAIRLDRPSRSSPRRCIAMRRFLVLIVIAAAVAVLLVVPASGADSAVVSRGDLHAFATGTGLDIGGHAQMVRTAGGRTYVTVHADGLLPNTTYPSHVHALPCGQADADGHYKRDPAGPATRPTRSGRASRPTPTASATVAPSPTSRPAATAVSVVIHAPGGAKIACADLR